MALVNCPECNKQVYDKANACPNCGYPIQSTSDNIKPVSEPPAEELAIPTVSACPSCGKQLSSAAEYCNFCDTQNPSFKSSAFNWLQKDKTVCRQCASVIENKENHKCQSCGIGAPLSRGQYVKPIAIESSSRSQNDISESKTNSSSALIYWGYMLPSIGYLVFGGILLSIIGFIIGAINAARGSVFHGIAHMCLSAIVFVLTILGIAAIGLMEIAFNGY
ncbi:zinc ribbon domain-containing protein [Desulfuromonas sp. TF]|uniref:double zinc ribbon domain-containing protein n=1 Tax=Desulfuromonas sp. TF TaxID=1232410 RepID=UPI0012DD16DE|nr:zinc ribbon domain-containing protein [Desulfuromonas sp. TF]